MSGGGKLVCVTGASGYIASWMVKLLLRRGYSVNATVRCLKDPKKVEHLVVLEGAKERLQLFKADLNEEGSFDAAISSCVGVFHAASPCFLDTSDPQGELVDPAVKGTINVLGSCARASSVNRVVLTSSVAAMLFNGRPIAEDTIVDETWFSDHQYCRENQKWYGLSKTLAEEAALEYMKQTLNFDLIRVCPGRVMGPLLQPSMNASSALFFNLLTAETYVDASHGFVNVKDVAEAHVLAFELQSASGRYCMVESQVCLSQILRILKQAYPTLKLPHKCVEGEPYMPRCKFSRERAEGLGIEFTPFEITLKEMIESFKEKQYITL